MLIYSITAYLPCLIYQQIRAFENIYKKPTPEVVIILEAFFVVVISIRFISPRPKIPANEFSKLILINMTLVADILEMINALDRIKNSCNLFYPSLVIISLSTSSLAIGLTPKANLANQRIQFNRYCLINFFRKIFENETWNIIFLLFLRDM